MKNPLKSTIAACCALAGAIWTALRGAPARATATSRTAGGPNRILLMRHAEKTGDPEDIYLSDEGMKRAERLVTYIPEAFGRPDFIFAASRSKRSVRSIETVKPLAAAFGLKVLHHFEDDEFEDLVNEIFSSSNYHRAMIVVCWHHQKLAEIARLFGAQPGTYPDPWPGDVFNLILKFDYDPDSNALPSVAPVVEAF